jgi:Domain of unknown function DUF29
MATRVKPAPSQLYDQDFYAWSKAQADLLRARRYSELDLDHLIEEVDDLGDALKRSVRNRMRTIMEHLLKLQHSPAPEPPPPGVPPSAPNGSSCATASKPRSAGRLRLSSLNRTLTPARWPRAHSVTTARPRPPMRCPRPAPMTSTRSPATGCREKAMAYRLTTADWIARPGRGCPLHR